MSDVDQAEQQNEVPVATADQILNADASAEQSSEEVQSSTVPIPSDPRPRPLVQDNDGTATQDDINAAATVLDPTLDV